MPNTTDITSWSQILSRLIPPREQRGTSQQNWIKLLEKTGSLLGGASLGLITFFLITVLDDEVRNERTKRVLIAANISEGLELLINVIKTGLEQGRIERMLNIANALSNGYSSATLLAGTVVFWTEGLPHTEIPALLFFSGMVQRVAVMVATTILACDSIMQLEKEAQETQVTDPALSKTKRDDAAALKKEYIDNLPARLEGIILKAFAPLTVLAVLILGFTNIAALGFALTMIIAYFSLRGVVVAGSSLVGNCIDGPQTSENPPPVSPNQTNTVTSAPTTTPTTPTVQRQEEEPEETELVPMPSSPRYSLRGQV